MKRLHNSKCFPAGTESVLRRQRKRRILGLALPVLLAFQGGCIYLHNDGRAKQAASVLSQYRAFQTNSGGVFALMLENHARVQQALAERQATDAELKFKAYASGLPSMRWTEVKAEITELQNQSGTRRTEAETSFANAVAQQAAGKAQLKTAQDALNELQKQVKAARNEQHQWQAREELFKGLLQFYTDHPADFSKTDMELLQQANKEILGRTIPGQTNTVGSLLSDDLKNLEKFKIEAAAGPHTVDFLDPRQAPGIKVQLLSLGADLAAGRVKRVQLDLARLNSLNACWTNQQAALDLQNSHLIKALTPITGFLAASNDEVIGVKVAAFQKAPDANARAELERGARGFTYYLLAVTYDESLVRELETQPSAIAHEYAIRLNQINEQEREALVLRGLESLNVYHQGGITSDEIANLIRAAEAAGIGVIGAGVFH